MTLLNMALRPQRPIRLLLLAVFITFLFYYARLADYGPATFLPGVAKSNWQGTMVRGVDVLKYINPLIGTINGGHVFPGPTLPYGMAKPCPDVLSPGENAAGFVSDNNPIAGFSHMHDSGTGGNPSMGNFPVYVHPGCPEDDLTKCWYTLHGRQLARVPDSTKARLGYFSIDLVNSVRAEMTASMHTALYRFSFSKEDSVASYNTTFHDIGASVNSPIIQIDLNDLGQTSSSPYAGCQVYPETGRMIGEGTFSPSFGRGQYKAYFCADFKGAKMRRVGTFKGNNATTDEFYLNGVSRGFENPSGSGGPWIQFEKTSSVLARVGMSFMSPDQACKNAEEEIPTFDFEGTVKKAEQAWREKMSPIEVDVTGVDEDMLTVFWSGLYRSLVSPQNYTGENPLWQSDEPYFDSFYCIWDSFRAQHPLLSIIDPGAQAEMVRALLDIYRFAGKLPDCRMSFSKGFSQGGSNADVVMADAFIKNIAAGVNWTTVYEAVLSDAERTPKDWSVEGRGNLESWRQYGYIAVDHIDREGMGPQSRSVSRTVEYAYDDYSIAVLAQALGYEDDYHKYMNRSGFWKNVWNPLQPDQYYDENEDIRITAFKGFPQPRLMNGTFKYQNTRTCSPSHEKHKCYFDTSQSTYEGSPWLYSFFAPQDMNGLIEIFGGRDAFVKRLDYYHEVGIVDMGNEQAFLTVYQFHHAGRPGRSSYWLHEYIPSQFNASINGIPGNDDCAMGAFSTLAMMGFFPVAGQSVYLLSPPFFSEVRLQSRGEHPAVIKKAYLPGQEDGIYIQSATLNGEPYTKNWISHDFFTDGGILELIVGRNEGSWGTREEDVPPSYPPDAGSAYFPSKNLPFGSPRGQTRASNIGAHRDHQFELKVGK